MTNKEILRANLLDIIFENRNKEYGAYALRNDYDRRLLKALGIGLGLVLLLILINFLRISNTSAGNNPDEKDSISITKVDLATEKIIEPEKPKLIEKPKAAERVATIQNTTIKIVPNDKVNNKVPSVDDLADRLTSTVTASGSPFTNQLIVNTNLLNNGNGGELKVAEPEKSIKIREQAPEYPGGPQALIEFMRSNLVTPEELQIGEKKIVRVKFIVGTDGSITDIKILESPGRDYEREVSRVVRKMPRWKPGIQNDITVAVGYVLPVTFMAVEE